MSVEKSTTDVAPLNNSLERDILDSLGKGFSFLCGSQLKSGEFPIMRWQRGDKDACYVKTVFATSFVLHSLRHVGKFLNVDEVSKRAVEFLLGETENSLWRFCGKGSRIHFDLDTTCCVLASLKEYDIDLDYEAIASKLLKYRNAQGVFYTWILNVDPPFEKADNNVDWVVNANVLFFYSLLGWSLPELERYLIRVVETKMFKQRSPYYDSPFCFTYCLTRAYGDGKNLALSLAIPKIKEHILEFMEKPQGDPLDVALASVSLLNCGIEPASSAHIMKCLLSMQRMDGGWPAGIFFTQGPYTEHRVVYGSEALTTAIALEAISKYMEKCGELRDEENIKVNKMARLV
jgi:hypothetical protein